MLFKENDMSMKMYSIEETYRLVWPDNFRHFTMDSPALSVVTDFRFTMPLVIESDTPAYDLEELMTKAHERFKLVVDSDNRFIGLVALEDLQHPDFLARIAAVYTRDSLTVSEVMRPRHTLQALDYPDLEKATIRDIIESLKDFDYHHCLVVDRGAEEVRGLVSASDIEKHLLSPTTFTKAPGFAKLYQSLNP